MDDEHEQASDDDFIDDHHAMLQDFAFEAVDSTTLVEFLQSEDGPLAQHGPTWPVYVEDDRQCASPNGTAAMSSLVDVP